VNLVDVDESAFAQRAVHDTCHRVQVVNDQQDGLCRREGRKKIFMLT
jgi:hypothetical protein